MMDGFLTCQVKTHNSQRFFNLCKSNNIHLYNISTKDSFTCFTITIKDYKKIRPIVKKSHVIPHITKKSGLPIIIQKYRHKIFTVIIILLCLLLLFYFSSFIWNIQFHGNQKYSNATLIKVLEELNIKTGILKKHIDLNQLEEDLRLKLNDLVWVSANIEGTILIINIKESIIIEKNEEVNLNGDIISDVDCIIESIVTHRGTPKVTKGQKVQAGDTLISGTVSILNDDLTKKADFELKAEGEITGTFRVTYNDLYPKWIIDNTNRHKTNYGLSFILFDKKINIGNTDIIHENCIQTKNHLHYKITPSFYLPFQIITYKNEFYTPQKKYYSDQQALQLANEKIDKIINVIKDNDGIIHKNNLQIKFEKEYFGIYGDLEITAPIGQFISCQ